jgi:hypothetical protein
VVESHGIANRGCRSRLQRLVPARTLRPREPRNCWHRRVRNGGRGAVRLQVCVSMGMSVGDRECVSVSVSVSVSVRENIRTITTEQVHESRSVSETVDVSTSLHRQSESAGHPEPSGGVPSIAVRQREDELRRGRNCCRLLARKPCSRNPQARPRQLRNRSTRETSHS